MGWGEGTCELRWPVIRWLGFAATFFREEREKGSSSLQVREDAPELFPEPIDFIKRETDKCAVGLSEHRRQYQSQAIAAARRQRNGDAPAVGRPLVTQDQVLV